MKTYIYIDEDNGEYQVESENYGDALSKILNYIICSNKEINNAKTRCLKKCETIEDAIELMETFAETNIIFFGEAVNPTVNKLCKIV